MIKTFKDSKSNKIYTEKGEHIQDLTDYQARVRAGEYSGTPEDISKMPGIIRTDDGGMMSKVTADLSGLDSFKNNTQFLNSVKDVIQRKQKIASPLTAQKAYWRTLTRDVSPFGDVRATQAQVPGQFSDESFRLMSPADQAAVRSSREAAAMSHLQGIAEEEQYRGTRIEDLIGNMSDLFREKKELEKEALEAKKAGRDEQFDAINMELKELEKERAQLAIIAAKLETGTPVSDESYTPFGFTPIRGRGSEKNPGSLTWRNRNPGAIKMYYDNAATQMSGLAKDLLAKGWDIKKGSPMVDDNGNPSGYAISFATDEQGWQGAAYLLRGSAYKKLGLEEAMRQWSAQGYGAKEIMRFYPGVPVQKKFPQYTKGEMDKLLEAMAANEEWREGDVMGVKGDDKIGEMTSTLSNLMGVPESDFSGMDEGELEVTLSAFESLAKEDIKSGVQTEKDQQAYDDLTDIIVQEKARKTSPDAVLSTITELNKTRNWGFTTSEPIA